MKNHKLFFAVIILLTCLALFLKNLGPTIFPGDSPEIVTGVLTLSVVHALGFPFYTLLANIFKSLPLGSPAWRINLMSSVSGMIAILVLLYTVELFMNLLGYQENRRLYLFWSVLFVLSIPAFFYQIIRAEVYALNILFFLGVLYLAFRCFLADQEERASYFLLFFLLGLSFGVHIFLNAPILLILFFVLNKDGSYPFRVNLEALLFFLAGLAVYLYLPLRANKFPPISWGALTDFSALEANFVFFRQLGLTSGVSLGPRIAKIFLFFVEQLNFLLILALPGLYLLIKKKFRLGCAFALIIAVNIGVYLRHVDFSDSHLDFLGYELISMLALSLLALAGLAFLLRAVFRLIPASRFRTGLHSTITFALVLNIIPLWGKTPERTNYLAYRYALDAINSAGGGYFLVQGNMLTFTLSYLAHIENRGHRIKFYSPFGGGIFSLVKEPGRYERSRLTRKRRALFKEIITNKRPLYSSRALKLPYGDWRWRQTGLLFEIEDEVRGEKAITRFIHWPPTLVSRPFDNKSRLIIAFYLVKGGEIFAQRGRVDLADKLWRRAWEFAFDDASLLIDLGVHYINLGNNNGETAIQLFERALAIKPDLDLGHSNLASALYYTRGDISNAKRHALLALKLQPKNTYARELLRVLALKK